MSIASDLLEQHVQTLVGDNARWQTLLAGDVLWELAYAPSLGHPAVEALKADGAIPRRVALRQCKYLNNVIEQDHRTVKKRVWLANGYGSFQSAWRTLQGIETVNMIRKVECDGWPKEMPSAKLTS